MVQLTYLAFQAENLCSSGQGLVGKRLQAAAHWSRARNLDVCHHHLLLAHLQLYPLDIFTAIYLLLGMGHQLIALKKGSTHTEQCFPNEQ